MERKGEIKLVNINKYYGKNHVVKDLNFVIKPGEFISLLGPSGCGKTTILRMIAGLETLNNGEIYVDNKRIDGLEPYKRPLNTVFQHYALFPHLNVYENISYGLKAKHLSKNEINKKVKTAMDMVQLNGFEKRMPNQMSGGQKQRVSIARAIVNESPVLLLDEPLTALDLKLRKQMRLELRSLQKKLGITFVFVTHDQEEALVMSDRIAIMNKGKIEQVGTPYDIYKNPVSQFVAEFIGETNVFEAMVAGSDGENINLSMECGNGLAKEKGYELGNMVNVSIRPDKMMWSKEPVDNFNIPGAVTQMIFDGTVTKAIVTLTNGREVKITKVAGEGLPNIDDVVYLYWDINDAVVMKTFANDIHSVIENVDLTAYNN